jgi:hypothetical protein
MESDDGARLAKGIREEEEVTAVVRQVVEAEKDKRWGRDGGPERWAGYQI